MWDDATEPEGPVIFWNPPDPGEAAPIVLRAETARDARLARDVLNGLDVTPSAWVREAARGAGEV